MAINAPIITCHDCGLLQQITHMPEDGAVKCCRCDATLRKRQRVKPEKSEMAWLQPAKTKEHLEAG